MHTVVIILSFTFSRIFSLIHYGFDNGVGYMDDCATYERLFMKGR